jgi:hypothetical protein
VADLSALAKAKGYPRYVSGHRVEYVGKDGKVHVVSADLPPKVLDKLLAGEDPEPSDYGDDRPAGGMRFGRSPGAPVNDFDADLTPDRPNIGPLWTHAWPAPTPPSPEDRKDLLEGVRATAEQLRMAGPPEPPPRFVAPVDCYIDRPEVGPGVRTVILAGYEIRPDLLAYEMRSAATGRRVKPKRA